MYTEDRNAYRKAFIEAWQKHLKKLPLEPVEHEIVTVINMHPEYHLFIESNDIKTDFELEENPFLHLSLHISIREQIRMDRPHGIRQIYQELYTQYASDIEVEHLMMTVLANMIWEAQQSGQKPSEKQYLVNLRSIIMT